jgi:hypothetical protein
MPAANAAAAAARASLLHNALCPSGAPPSAIRLTMTRARFRQPAAVHLTRYWQGQSSISTICALSIGATLSLRAAGGTGAFSPTTNRDAPPPRWPVQAGRAAGGEQTVMAGASQRATKLIVSNFAAIDNQAVNAVRSRLMRKANTIGQEMMRLTGEVDHESRRILGGFTLSSSRGLNR